MRVSHGGRPRGGAARTARALVVAAVAALVAGCSSGDADVEATVSPLATGSPAPDKQVPVFAPSADPTADAPAGVSAQASPGAAVGGEGDGASSEAGADAASARSLDERAEALARDLFDLANEARDKEGGDALEWSECAAEQAVDRADTARGKEDLEHEELEFDCEATMVGENLVRGDGPAAALHQLWMDSEGHRDNILNEDFVDLGVGCVAHASGTRTEPAADADSIGGWVCSQMFYG